MPACALSRPLGAEQSSPPAAGPRAFSWLHPMSKTFDWPQDSDQAPTSKLLKECALGIGQAAIAWNHLHEELRDLYCELFYVDLAINADETGDMGSAQYKRLYRLAATTWNSVGFDRPKREMLKDVLASLSAPAIRQFPNLRTDVTWILKEATSLEDSRNDLIHSPVGVDYWTGAKDPSRLTPFVVPRIYGGNHRALKLMEKDLRTELEYCRDMAMTLRRFTSDVSSHISFLNAEPQPPWPTRPPLPTRECQNSRRGRHRQGALKALSPQHRKRSLEVARRLKNES